MKTIDLTPFRAENGEISFANRAQASLKLGMGWYDTVMATDRVQESLGKHLGNSFTLIRDLVLPEIGAKIPVILVGPAGVFVANVTTLRGLYRAKGDEWGAISGNKLNPAPVNLLSLTAKMAKAVQVYLNRQGFEGMLTVEPLILGADPGLQVESVRPIVRIVLVDALERFSISLTQARAVLNAEAVHLIVQRLQKPRTKEEAAPPPPPPVEERAEVDYSQPAYSSEPVSTDDLSAAFQFVEETPETAAPAEAATSAGAKNGSKAGAKPARKKKSGLMNLSTKQWAIIGAEIFFLVCVLIGFIVYMLVSNMAR